MKKILIMIISLFLFTFGNAYSYEVNQVTKNKINNFFETKVFLDGNEKRINSMMKAIDKIYNDEIITGNKRVIVEFLRNTFTEKFIKYEIERLYKKVETNINDYENIYIIEKYKNKKINIPTLMFHYIENVPSNTKDQLRYYLSYSPEKLDSMLQYINDNGMTTITYFDLKDILEGRKEMPDKPIMLTFDDGHLDHYTRAFPILEKYGSKGVFFVVSGFPDNDWNYMNWNQIREMRKAGHEIGSHTITHASLKGNNNELIKKEVLESKKKIEEELGEDIISFCYPYGHYNNYSSNLIKENYLFGRTTKHGTLLDTSKLNLQPKIEVGPNYEKEKISLFFN